MTTITLEWAKNKAALFSMLVGLIVTAAPEPGHAQEPVQNLQPVILTVRGGVSLGNYQAGVNWALIEFYKRANKNPQALDSVATVYGLIDSSTYFLPKFKLRLVAGASAGNINSLFTAITWCQKGNTALDASLFWKAWTQVGWEQLFPQIRQDKQIITENSLRDALFHRTFFNQELFPILKSSVASNIVPECEVPIAITLTRIVPSVLALVPSANSTNRIDIQTQRHLAVFKAVAEDGMVQFKPFFIPEDTVINTERFGKVIGPNFRPDSSSLKQVYRFSLASSAFPYAFDPVEIGYCKAGQCNPSNVNPDSATFLKATFLDGGAFDNFPLDPAYRINAYLDELVIKEFNQGRDSIIVKIGPATKTVLDYEWGKAQSEDAKKYMDDTPALATWVGEGFGQIDSALDRLQVEPTDVQQGNTVVFDTTAISSLLSAANNVFKETRTLIEKKGLDYYRFYRDRNRDPYSDAESVRLLRAKPADFLSPTEREYLDSLTVVQRTVSDLSVVADSLAGVPDASWDDFVDALKHAKAYQPDLEQLARGIAKDADNVLKIANDVAEIQKDYLKKVLREFEDTLNELAQSLSSGFFEPDIIFIQPRNIRVETSLTNSEPGLVDSSGQVDSKGWKALKKFAPGFISSARQYELASLMRNLENAGAPAREQERESLLDLLCLKDSDCPQAVSDIFKQLPAVLGEIEKDGLLNDLPFLRSFITEDDGGASARFRIKSPNPQAAWIRITNRYPLLAGQHLAAFGAFLGKPFREFDFYTGIYDATYFIANEYVCDKISGDDERRDKGKRAKCIREAMEVIHNQMLDPGTHSQTIFDRLLFDEFDESDNYAEKFPSDRSDLNGQCLTGVQQTKKQRKKEREPWKDDQIDDCKNILFQALADMSHYWRESRDSRDSLKTRYAADTTLTNRTVKTRYAADTTLSNSSFDFLNFLQAFSAYGDHAVKDILETWPIPNRFAYDADKNYTPDYHIDETLKELVRDPQRSLQDLLDQALQQMRRVEDNGSLIKIPAGLIHFYYQERLYPQVRGLKWATSIPRTRFVNARHLRWIAPFHLAWTPRFTGIEVTWRPSWHFKRKRLALTFPLTPFLVPPNKRVNQLYGAGVGVLYKIQKPKKWLLLSGLEVGVHAMNAYGEDFDPSLDAEVAVYLLAHRLRLAVRIPFSDDAFGSDKVYVTLGLSDLNGFVYWLSRLI